MATYGLNNLVYAVIDSEDKTGTTYSEVKEIAPAMTVGITRTTNRATLRGDDTIQHTAYAKGPASLTLGTTDLPKTVEAELLGKTVASNGLLLDKDSDRAPYVAVGFKAPDARGGDRYVWLYRVQFSLDETTFNTKQETPEFQTPTLTGQSLPRLNDGLREASAWDGDTDITDPTIFDDWFTEVVDGDYVPTV